MGRRFDTPFPCRQPDSAATHYLLLVAALFSNLSGGGQGSIGEFPRITSHRTNCGDWGTRMVIGGGMRAAEITEEAPFIHQTSLIDSKVAEAPFRSSAAAVRRLAWRTRYVIGLVTLDFLIGLGAAVAAFPLRFGIAEDGPNKQAS